MTTKQFKNLARLLKQAYKELEDNALATGVSILSTEFQDATAKVRELVLTKNGTTVEEYQAAKEKFLGYSASDVMDEVALLKKAVEELHIPTAEEIEEISHNVAKAYIKAPEVINKIVKEIKIQTPPQVIKETIYETYKEEYDDKNLREELSQIKTKLEDIKVPKVLTDEELEEKIKTTSLASFKNNINLLGMPDFRKLAMGLQAQIDAIDTGGSGTVGPGTTNEIAYFNSATTVTSLTTATYPSLTELSYVKGVTSAIQTQINAKAPSTSPTFATSITGSYLTASEILITDGSKNIVSAPVATYPSLTELTYLKGVTSAIQTQLNAKQASDATLTSIAALADASGVLTNDGAGNLSWGAAGSGANTALSNLASVAINTTLVSDTDNTDALGTSAIAWSDLFLGSGAVITFNSAPSTPDVTITHSANALAFAGASSGYTFDALTTVTATAGGSQKALVVNNSTSTGNIFEAQDNGTAVFTIADGGAVTMNGTFRINSTGSGTPSAFQVDAISTMTGADNTTIGADAGEILTTGAGNVYIGKSSGAGVNYASYNVGIGHNAGYGTNSGNGLGYSVAIGYQTAYNNVGEDSVAIGRRALYNLQSTTALGNIAIGRYAGNTTATGDFDYNIWLGYEAGYQQGTVTDDALAVGRSAVPTASNQAVFGSNTAPYSAWYFNGVTSTSPDDVTFNGAGGSGADIAGASVIWAAGKGTGAGTPGSLLFQTSTAAGSSSTLQTLTTRLTISSTAITAALPIYNGLGSNTVPSYSFTGDTNTGIYSPGADALSLVIGGDAVIAMTSGAVAFLGQIKADGFTDPTLPEYTWSADPNTGMYNSAANTIGFTTDGTLRLSISTTAITPTVPITLSENTSIDLDPALSADGKYSGKCITGTAGAALAFGDLIYLDPTDSRWELVDANSASGADGDARGVLGICVLAAAGDGSATKILLWGNVRADTAFPAMTINAPMYVSETAGDITGTIPTTSGAVQRAVGFAFTADELFFCPNTHYQTAV